MKHLTKQSGKAEIKEYFTDILNLSRSNEDFPVNLDDVWMLVFGRKQEAVRALTNDNLFMQDVDYRVLRKNAQNLQGGRPIEIYMLSLPCLEFFIARKVRPVFEVYRQVFHMAASGGLAPMRIGGMGDSLEETTAPLFRYHAMIKERWKNVLGTSKGNADADCGERDKHFRDYRADICKLVCAETFARLEGRDADMAENRVAASDNSLVYTEIADPCEASMTKDCAATNDEKTVRQMVNDIYKYVNWKNLVRDYFLRSQRWIYDKFLNRHNGKPFPFKDGERIRLKYALMDISERMRVVAERL